MHVAPFVLLDALAAYAAYDAAERRQVERMRDFVLSRPDAFERTSLAGHVTGSAWIVDRTGSATVLMHHRKLGIWVQPGGHADGEGDVRAVAAREAQEETGLASLVLAFGGIYDIDIHAIPARANEPAHDHFDLRFAFFADPAEAPRANAESHAVAWIRLAEIERYAIDDSVRRLAAKTATLCSALH